MGWDWGLDAPEMKLGWRGGLPATGDEREEAEPVSLTLIASGEREQCDKIAIFGHFLATLG